MIWQRSAAWLALCILLMALGCSNAPTKPGRDRVLEEVDRMIAAANVDKADSTWRTHLPPPGPVRFERAHEYYARMVTNKGEIVIRFLPDVAPVHVTNFIYLSRLGFYDGLRFHRVIPGFMAQGGDPLGNGTGGPGYRFAGELADDVKHDRPGRLSMANAGLGTDGSQFFLTFVPAPWLDGKHTIFGDVVSGFETLHALELAGSQSGWPTELLKIETVMVEVAES